MNQPIATPPGADEPTAKGRRPIPPEGDDPLLTTTSVLDALQQRPGNEAAWKSFLDVYDTYLWGVLRRLGGSDDILEEAMLQARLELWNALPKYRHGRTGSFRKWLRVILIRCRARAYRKYYHDHPKDAVTLPAPEAEPDGFTEQDGLYVAAVAREAVARARARTHAPGRWESFELNVIFGVPPVEVMRRLGRSRGQVDEDRSAVLKRVEEEFRSIWSLQEKSPAPLPVEPKGRRDLRERLADYLHHLLGPQAESVPVPSPASDGRFENSIHLLSHFPPPEEPGAWLLLLDGDQAWHQLPERTIKLGRHESCDLQLDNSEVSGEHAEISFAEGIWSLRDLGSQNGCRLDGEKLSEFELCVGAQVHLGPYRLLFWQSPGDDCAPGSADPPAEPLGIS